MRPALVGAAILLAGCVTGKPAALKPSVEETFQVLPGVAYQAALQAVTDQGLPLREADPATRVIQTSYVDISSYEPRASVYAAAERMVRFRVLLAPSPESSGTVVAIFGVYIPFRTGISTSERGEREIPRDHPGMTVVRKIRDAIATTLGQ